MAEFGISAREAQELAGVVRQIGEDVNTIAQKFLSDVDKGKKKIDDIGKKAREIGDEAKKRQDILLTAAAKWSTKYLDDLNQVERKWRTIGEVIRKNLSEGHGVSAGAGNALGISGQRGMFGAATGVINQLSSMLPMGGVMGLMLFGEMKQSEWYAQAYTAARQLAQVGTVTKSTIGEINSLSQNLAMRWGMDPGGVAQELGVAAGAFARFGVSSKELDQKSGQTFGKMQMNILSTTFAMDKLHEAAAGTWEGFVGEAIQSSGEGVAEVANQVGMLGSRLRDTGANVNMFMGQMMQSLSGLRLQRQGVDDLAKTYFTLSDALGAGALKGAGPQAIASQALSGMKALASGAGSLPEGLAGFIGQRMGATSGAQAIVAMQEGSLGKGGEYLGEVTKQLGQIAQEITGGGTREEQIFSLMKVAPSLGFEGSRAVVDINKRMAEDINKGMSHADAQKKYSKELSEAFKSQDAKTSDFQKAMKQLTMVMVEMGAGLFKIVSAGFSVLTDLDFWKGLFRAVLPTWMMQPASKVQLKREEMALEDAISVSQQAEEGQAKIIQAAETAGKVVGGIVRNHTGKARRARPVEGKDGGTYEDEQKETDKRIEDLQDKIEKVKKRWPGKTTSLDMSEEVTGIKVTLVYGGGGGSPGVV